jgi:carbohydrate kinase (thermoresistant glucokinase family)
VTNLGQHLLIDGELFGWRGFLDGDSLHPMENVAKKAAGTPLTDEDRWPWLATVSAELANAGDDGIVLACSALRRNYRDAI